VLKTDVNTDTLTVVSDGWVYLYTMNKKRSTHPVRIIKAIKKSDAEAIAFISITKKMRVKEITEIYKSRWQKKILQVY
jgi:hypothetical protein